MNPNFKDYLGKLPTFLFPDGGVEQPKLVAGTPVLAGDVAGYVEYYVNLLNSDDKLSPHSMFQVYNTPKTIYGYYNNVNKR